VLSYDFLFHFHIQEFLRASVRAQLAERRLQQHSADFRGFVLREKRMHNKILALDRSSVETHSLSSRLLLFILIRQTQQNPITMRSQK